MYVKIRRDGNIRTDAIYECDHLKWLDKMIGTQEAKHPVVKVDGRYLFLYKGSQTHEFLFTSDMPEHEVFVMGDSGKTIDRYVIN
jgi:hypothetical protein